MTTHQLNGFQSTEVNRHAPSPPFPDLSQMATITSKANRAVSKVLTANVHNKRLAIICHGGAYSIPDNLVDASEKGCRAAAIAGMKVLRGNGSALDAVESAIKTLENDPAFDAGYGSVLTSDRTIEMDACIMDGRNLNAGGVACVKTVRNPITLARNVMERTDHVLIVGSGADKFARDVGMEEVGTDDLLTEAAKEEYNRFTKYRNSVGSLFNNAEGMGHDTVGAVAIDMDGNIAAGTSTGGITAKYAGRVGDSPIIGSGLYADNALGGVSSTGHGESIAKVILAKDSLDVMSRQLLGGNPTEALKQALDFMKAKVDGCGGTIAISPSGRTGHAFTTPRMCWSSIESKDIDADTGEMIGFSGIEKKDRHPFVSGMDSSYDPKFVLHVYDHCPYCIRVELVLGWLNVDYERKVYGYGDMEGPTALTGKKQLPVLEHSVGCKAGEVNYLPESLDIINFLLSEEDLTKGRTLAAATGRADLKEWSKEKFKPHERILTRPRMLRMELFDFQAQRDKEYARKKYENGGFDYGKADALNEDSKQKMTVALQQFETFLHSDNTINGNGEYEMDDVVYLPDLRKLTCVKGLVWPERVKKYVANACGRANVALYESNAI